MLLYNYSICSEVSILKSTSIIGHPWNALISTWMSNLLPSSTFSKISIQSFLRSRLNLSHAWTDEINDFCSFCIYEPKIIELRRFFVTAPGIVNTTCGETDPTMRKTLTPNRTISKIRHKYHDPFAKL
jgi:hypothetical protein